MIWITHRRVWFWVSLSLHLIRLWRYCERKQARTNHNLNEVHLISSKNQMEIPFIRRECGAERCTECYCCVCGCVFIGSVFTLVGSCVCFDYFAVFSHFSLSLPLRVLVRLLRVCVRIFFSSFRIYWYVFVLFSFCLCRFIFVALSLSGAQFPK